MQAESKKFRIQAQGRGFVLMEECYVGGQLVASKELGMIHLRKADALRALESLVVLNRASSPHLQIEREVG